MEHLSTSDCSLHFAALIDQLLSDRTLKRLRAAQNILRLSDTYGRQRLESGCMRALTDASPSYSTVKTILAGGFFDRVYG